MQDALPPFVLHSEAIPANSMDDAPNDIAAGQPVSPPTDEQLMQQFAQGTADAFTQLFERYKQPVFGFFRRRVADPAQAEELTQETFLAIVRGAARYEPRALFRTFLYAIAFKILRAHRRKHAFRATFLGERKSAHDPATRDGTDASLYLREAVAKLDATDREILLLREFEELSYAEIAELLHLPLNTVRSRLFRARMALRELLQSPAPAAAPKLTESEERV